VQEKDWRQLIREVGTRVGVVLASLGGVLAFIAAVGGAIVWTRFQAANLPAEQALDAMPRGELIATGAISLAAFGVLGVVAAASVFLIDHGGKRMRRTPGLSRGLLVLLTLEAIAITAMAVTHVDSHGWFRWGVATEVLVILMLLSFTLIRTDTDFARTTRYADTEQADPPTASPPTAATAASAPPAAGDGDKSIAPFPKAIVVTEIAVAAVTAVATLAALALGGPWRPILLIGLGLVIAVPFSRFAFKWVKRDGRRPNDDDEGLFLTRRGGTLIILLAIGTVAMPTLLMWGTWWIAAPLAAATLLGVAAWLIASTDPGFIRYGMIVFASVPCIGAVLTISSNAANPQVQPMALIRVDHGEREALQGIYVTENDERVYFANVATEGCTGEIAPHSGRMMWVPRDKVAATALGPRQGVEDAGRAALEMYYDLAPSVANPPTLTIVGVGRRRGESERTHRAQRQLTDAGPALRHRFVEPPRLDTAQARVGDEVTLRGGGFGASVRTLRVGGVEAAIAPRIAGVHAGERPGAGAPNFHWNDWAIRFIVPRGAISGRVTIECDKRIVTPAMLAVQNKARARITIEPEPGGTLILDGRGDDEGPSRVVTQAWEDNGVPVAPNDAGVFRLPPDGLRHDLELNIVDAEDNSSSARATVWRIPIDGAPQDFAQRHREEMEQIRATLAGQPDATLVVHSQYRANPAFLAPGVFYPLDFAQRVHEETRGNVRQRKGTTTILRAFGGDCPRTPDTGRGYLDAFVLDPGSEVLPPPNCEAVLIEQ
jgi:hypothetical protein